MGMVLLILGKILIKLLEILGILILILLLLLFLPIRYKVYGEYKGEQLYVKGRAMWMLGLIYCPARYDGKKITWKIRVLGIDVGKCLKRRKRKKNRRKESSKRMPETKEAEQTMPNTEGSDSDTKEPEKKEVPKDESGKKVRIAEKKADKKAKKPHKRNGEKKRYEKLKTIFSPKGRCALKKCFFSTKSFVCILKDNVIHLWRKLKPRVVRGYVEFGTGDPYTTGQILGTAAFFYGYYGKGLRVIPNFEEKKIQAELLIKGKIRLITILVIVARLLMSKELKNIRRDFGRVKEIAA